MTAPVFSFRPVESYSDILQTQAIQEAIWGKGAATVLQPNIVRAFIRAGGIVIGAYHESQMVGFVASFQGILNPHDKKLIHWSHIVAVLPDYRRYGVGRGLKLAQREAALQQGISLIAWTFDPMRRANAIFNIEVLGAEVPTLHQEFYGILTDELNGGLKSDRFEVHWPLSQPQVKKLAAGKPRPIIEPASPETYVTKAEDQEPSLTFSVTLDQPEYRIELPSDIDALRRASTALSGRWYEALRQSAQALFSKGYKIERVYAPPDAPTFAYILRQPQTWFLYVVETRDGSFYTGITPDLEKRIATHNAGKGAGYTAKRLPVRLIAAWRCLGGKIQAMKLEYAFKHLTRAQKLKYIRSTDNYQMAIRHL